jgi:hypothetical protein
MIFLKITQAILVPDKRERNGGVISGKRRQEGMNIRIRISLVFDRDVHLRCNTSQFVKRDLAKGPQTENRGEVRTMKD